MKTCDKCQYCYEQSNHYKDDWIHTIRFICEKKPEGVNPDGTCELWKERKGKMKIRYKNGEMGEVEDDVI